MRYSSRGNSVVEFTYLRQPPRRWTFQPPLVRKWVEENCGSKVLNLFSGKTKLPVNEIRVDADPKTNPDVCMDALKFVRLCVRKKVVFDTVILDPPYSYRKSMEKYNGMVASPFRQLKDALIKVVLVGGRVITFGYHSTSMGRVRGFKLTDICLIGHGGAQHDTIAIVEEKQKSNR